MGEIGLSAVEFGMSVNSFTVEIFVEYGDELI